MNKTSIEWCDYTLNPAVGCKHGCYYCYAKKVHQRFWPSKRFEDIRFFHERLEEPAKVKKPSTIFVGSMSDPAFWTSYMWAETLRMCRENPQHTFMFLTKNPQKAYIQKIPVHNIPANVKLGLTMDFLSNDDALMQEYLITMHSLSRLARVFLSIEPLLGKIIPSDYYFYDSVIIGAMTGNKSIAPKPEWIASIENVPKELIFYKSNIERYLNE